MFTTILTSAVVGAFAGGIIQQLGAILERNHKSREQALEREARRQEQLVKMAFELANTQTERVIQFAKDNPHVKATITGELFHMADYLQGLNELWDEGKLSAETLAKYRRPET